MADDDSDDRLMLDELFIELGGDEFELESVENGLEVINLLKRISEESRLPNLIILDQNMPIMSGKETLSYLKSSKKYKNIPTIVYSTYYSKDFAIECAKLGANWITSKPDSYEGFKLMVKSFMERAG